MNSEALIPVSEKLYLVNSPTEGRFPMAFSFLILGSDTHALIDTGCGPAACRHVMETFGIDVVINSHCHPDHVSGNYLFSEKDLLVPQERVDEVGAIDRLAYRLLGPDDERMDSWKKFVRRDLGMRDYVPTRTFKDGDVFDFGGISIQTVHTPGHLDDHYCFWIPGEDILLTFDVDLTGFGPFYGNPESDIPTFKESIGRILKMNPRVAASSHRLPVQEEVRKEILSFHEKFSRNEGRIASLMTVPRTLKELCVFKPFYGKHPKGMEIMYEFFEGNMIRKHLECMEIEGKVRQGENGYFLTHNNNR